jgi:hypothetical protein
MIATIANSEANEKKSFQTAFAESAPGGCARRSNRARRARFQDDRKFSFTLADIANSRGKDLIFASFTE